MSKKDFFVIISPGERIIRDISLLKKSCAKHIGIFPALYSKAHISLIKSGEEISVPRQSIFIYEQFFRMIAHRVAQIESVKLDIKGFNFFTHGQKSRTIYAELNLSPEIMNWFEILKDVLRIDKPVTPHITIAKAVPIKDFEKLWPFFEKIEYRDSFIPDCLTVLTREIGNKLPNYSVLTELNFYSYLLKPVA